MAALYMATGRVDDADSFLQRAQRLDDMGALSSQEVLLALVQEFRAGLQDTPEEDTPREDRRRQDARDENSSCAAPGGTDDEPGDSHATRLAAPARRGIGSLSAPRFSLQAAPNPVLVCP